MEEFESKIEELYKDMNSNFYNINKIIDTLSFETEDEYKRINRTYFLINKTHYEAFLLLIKGKHIPSSFILIRTVLETFVKSCFLEYIEKPRKKPLETYLIDKKKFPPLLKMVEKLESYKYPSGIGFNGFFNQFLKKELGTYEKLSYFSHSNGKYIRKFYESGSVNVFQEDTFNIVNFMQKTYISNVLFHLKTFEHIDELKKFILLYEKTLKS